MRSALLLAEDLGFVDHRYVALRLYRDLMSLSQQAFPWLFRLRSIRPLVEPVIAVILFIASALSTGSYGLGAILIGVLGPVAIAVVRLVPWVSVTLLFLVIPASAAVSWSTLGWSYAAAALVLAELGALRRPVERWVALGASVVVGAEIPLLSGQFGWGVIVNQPAYAISAVLLIAAWGIGTSIGEGAARIRAVARFEVLTDQLDASQLQLAVTAERERVAQEVHDVVAHSLAVILAQAEGARALSTKRPAAMTDALDRIAGAARSALLDVRGIVDGLTGGDEPPQPTVDDLPELLRGVEEAGVAVRSTSAGEARELGLAQQTAVYRIVQEGATNAIRHRGRGSALDVVLDWRGPGLSIQVVSSGTGDAEPAPGAGRGIPGMTERARIAGGWLAAGEDESGDHRITAFVPFRPFDTPASPATQGPEARGAGAGMPA